MHQQKPDFLHTWTRQLLKEHDFICRRYGLKLSRPIVEIVDVSSYWGKWITGSSTICLSRALLSDHSWDTVLNVLKHEMAHQLVTEKFDGTPAGHGPKFKRACEMLGLPASFRKASSTVVNNSTPGAWPKQSEMERINSKIRKLLALGDSTNQHESLIAMKKAQQLLDRYNISEANKKSKNCPSCSNYMIYLKRKRIENYHRSICSLLIEYFHIEIVITPLYDARDLTNYKCIDIMGKRENVKIAGYVYHFLMDRLPALWRTHQAANHGAGKGRNSYWLGVLNGFREGLAENRSTRKKEAAQAESNNLLPTTTADQAVGLFVASRYPKLKNSRKRPSRIDLARFESGLKDGRLLKFRQGLDRAGDKQKLIGQD